MGTKLTGKVESALGSMVGSSTLKAKGLEKEREANSANMQALELAEAERLEREAMMRRQKVLGHGASFNSVWSTIVFDLCRCLSRQFGPWSRTISAPSGGWNDWRLSPVSCNLRGMPSIRK